jgi:nitroreductase
MDYMELIKKRYSVRAYKSVPVEEFKLDQILEAARIAPTAANRQPFRLVIAKTEGRVSEFKSVYDRDWFIQAPLVICACGCQEEGWVRYDGKSYIDVDVAIVMDHLILAAANLGLGTCWIASFNVEVTRQVFGLPDELDPIVLTPLGYPNDQPTPKERKKLTDLVHYERW